VFLKQNQFIMIKVIVTLAFIVLDPLLSPAQTMQQNDSSIMTTIIQPMLERNESNPNWESLGTEIQSGYGKTYVDRGVTRAKIYYYYNKDWPLFSTALVHYTVTFEDKENFKLMDKNAKMVLEHSQQPEEWKAAQGWVKHAMDKEPGDAGYRATYDALTTKIKGQALGQ
jgi:hypothetical protein